MQVLIRFERHRLRRRQIGRRAIEDVGGFFFQPLLLFFRLDLAKVTRCIGICVGEPLRCFTTRPPIRTSAHRDFPLFLRFPPLAVSGCADIEAGNLANASTNCVTR
jgi:hypothetical protein